MFFIFVGGGNKTSGPPVPARKPKYFSTPKPPPLPPPPEEYTPSDYLTLLTENGVSNGNKDLVSLTTDEHKQSVSMHSRTTSDSLSASESGGNMAAEWSTDSAVEITDSPDNLPDDFDTDIMTFNGENVAEMNNGVINEGKQETCIFFCTF